MQIPKITARAEGVDFLLSRDKNTVKHYSAAQLNTIFTCTK
jgi:hypothetical protein